MFAQSAGAIEYTNCNKCPGYDTKQSDGEGPVMLGLWGMWSTPSMPLLPGPLWPSMVAPDKGPIYGLNRTNGIFMLIWIVWLNWITWNRNVFDNWTVLTFTYAKLNCLKLNCFWHWNCVLTLNWIVIYRTVLTFYSVNKICTYT